MALLTLAPAAIAQVTGPVPRRLLNLTRPLTPTEIAIVLKGVQEAIDGKTLRLGPESIDPQMKVRMGPSGRPRIIQMPSAIIGGIVRGLEPGAKTPPPSMTWREEITTILHYTGLPARRCDGSFAGGEMVIEYTRRGTAQQWTAATLPKPFQDARLPRPLAMLRGVEHMVSGERRQVGDRWTRAIVAPWTPPISQGTVEPAPLIGDPTPNVLDEPLEPEPNDATQSLWIDIRTLRPLRWEVTKPDPARVIMAQRFIYESFDLRPPAGIEAPRCIR